MRRRILLLLAFIGLNFTLSQADEKMNFHILDVKSGISDNYIQNVLHDRYGFMWFATCNGLDRYDGYHFKQYSTRTSKAHDNNVEWVAEDYCGTIWVKAISGFYLYDREKDELNNNIHPFLSEMGIKGVIKQLYVDENKNLWCVVGNDLYNYQYETKKLSKFALPENIKLLYLTCRGTVGYVLLSDGSISRINWTANKLTKETSISLNPGFHPHVYLDTFYNVWLYVTHGSQIECYSTREKAWVTFPGQRELKEERNNITTITDDGQGNIWIGTDNSGVLISHYYKNQITRIRKEVGKIYSLPNNHITCIFKDDRGIMWIGTGKQGVAYASLNNLVFDNIRCPQQEDVNSLLEDSQGNLWMGFDGEGIARYNPKTKNYTFFNPENSNIPSNLIVCSFIDSKKRIWWGSFGEGAFYFEKENFVPLAKLVHQSAADLPRYVRRITEDDSGNIWFATYAQGLVCMDTMGKVTSYHLDNSILQTNYIADISCADGRMMYIATSTGVYCMDTYTKKLVQLVQDSSGNEIIHDGYANCLWQDSRGLLWIGGRKGVNVYNQKENKLLHLGTSNGLSHPYIRGIVEDRNKNMWITTDHGVTCVSVTRRPGDKVENFFCTPYFEEDGLINFTFNNFAAICNKAGDVLFGGSGGYVSVSPVISQYTSFEHPVLFTGLYLANKRLDVGDKTPDGRVVLTKNLQLLDEITMKYSDSNFTLEVSSVDYGNLHKVQYVYRLAKKEEWVKLEGNRIIFNRLSPGTYHLQVKVNENPGSDNNPVTTLIILVTPPYWLSFPAYIFYIVSVLSLLVFFIFRFRRKHIRMLQQNRREMEINQQHEMDEAKMRFFTNVSHDLRTPLSLIITPLEKIIASNMPAEVKNELDVMHRNALTLLDEVNQLLDFRRLDQQKVQLSLAYGNLSDFIKETCTVFESLAAKKGLTLHIRLNAKTLEMNFDRNKMQRILLNLLSNAVKYNNENGTIIVTLDKILTELGEQIRIQIADTGVGIKDENKERIFDRFFQEDHTSTTYIGSGIGLHIVKEYVTLHGGSIVVKDNLPQGSVFIVTIPVTGAVETLEKDSVLDKLEDEQPSDELMEKNAVLIVEDNDDFRSFLINCLKEHYAVYEASDGKKALAVLAKHSIQVVLTDVMMPVMDGMELCHRIKTDIHYSHIPVIMLTARTAEEHVLNGLKEGADDYITKPFNLDILLLRIQKLLKWTQGNYEKFSRMDISPAEITISSLDEKLIEKAIAVVEENMDNSEFSVEDLSAAVCMSRGHLYKKLISITGKSPLEFIRILRIKRGKQLLTESQLGISQVAYHVGLSPKQFSKYFKDEYGCLPSEYGKAEDTNMPFPKNPIVL